jgi:hypothetical protein
MLSGALGRLEPQLTPLQFPYVSNDSWLAADLPKAPRSDEERLLYTACFAEPYGKGSWQCGLLLDEWTEVIPTNQATTGLTFHYDRPNSEPPQAMLLVTPAAANGAWEWEDLVGAVHDALDLTKLRALEPIHFDGTPYASFLPATIMASAYRPLTIAANLALNNGLVLTDS